VDPSGEGGRIKGGGGDSSSFEIDSDVKQVMPKTSNEMNTFRISF